MSCFGTLPQVTYLGADHRYPWRLERELIYYSDLLGKIVVPAGYCTDFASVPRVPLLYWLTGGRAVLPSVVHDYLYDARPDGVTRRQADRVFLEAMTCRRDPKRWMTRHAMYLGVRVGGGSGWRADSRHKLEGLRPGGISAI